MKVLWTVLAGVLLAGCAKTNNALFGVGDCHLEQLGQTPLEINDGLDIVIVGINGHPLRLVVDTGAEHSLISAAVARKLALPTDMEHATRSWGIGGPTARFDARVDSFMLAGLSLPVREVAVGDLSVGGIAGSPDGLLGTDVLRWFDLDINPGGHVLTLYRGEPCWLKSPPWPEAAVAIGGVQGIRSQIEAPRDLLVPINVDGTKALALFDTGSQASAISLSLSEDVGVPLKTLSADPTVTVGGAGPASVVLPLHRFHTLQVGAWVARDPVIPVLDVLQPEEEDPSVIHRRWQGVVGQDLLRNHRVWVSMAGWQIFLSQPDAVK